MQTASMSGSWQVNEKWAIRGGLGLILDGQLRPPNESAQKVKPGGLVAIGFEYLTRAGESYAPFVDLSVFLSGSSTEIENPNTRVQTNYFSSDLRLGARASWNIRNSLFPYVSARVFGGPVFWTLNDKDVIGTDIHHCQVALGTAIQFGRVGTFVEWAGIGEKALSMGMSLAW